MHVCSRSFMLPVSYIRGSPRSRGYRRARQICHPCLSFLLLILFCRSFQHRLCKIGHHSFKDTAMITMTKLVNMSFGTQTPPIYLSFRATSNQPPAKNWAGSNAAAFLPSAENAPSRYMLSLLKFTGLMTHPSKPVFNILCKCVGLKDAETAKMGVRPYIRADGERRCGLAFSNSRILSVAA
jgi:hypothetical protein